LSAAVVYRPTIGDAAPGLSRPAGDPTGERGSGTELDLDDEDDVGRRGRTCVRLRVMMEAMEAMEVVLRTRTPDGVEVVLFALVYAKILEEHPAVADLDLIDRTIREPDERRPDPRPGRERFFRREGDLWVLAVVDFEGVPAIIVTVFSTERAPI
jgi:hypothetical protein